MANPTLYPQFFSTLLPGFHTHLTIPLGFYTQYVQGKSVVKTAKLKSDSSEITWVVKKTGRRLRSGWEEFAIARNLRIGDVVVVRYEGDSVFRVSRLGTSCCEIQDLPAPRKSNQLESGKDLLKKRMYPRTQVDFSSDDIDDDDDEELPVQKKVSSSQPDNTSFVALVTVTNLLTDTLYLPQHFTSLNCLNRKCTKTILTDGGERSWTLDLRFNKSSDTFYITRGWRSFCDENGRKAGSFCMFKLAPSIETPVFSLCPADSMKDRSKRECLDSGSIVYSNEVGNIERERSEEEWNKERNVEMEISEDQCSSGDEWNKEEYIAGESSEDEYIAVESSMERGKTNHSLKRTVRYSSYSPDHKRFIKFTLPPDYIRIKNLCLPAQFARDNNMNKSGLISLLGKDGTKRMISLIMDNKGTMSLGAGWKDFVRANNLESCESFTLELVWKDATPTLKLFQSEPGSSSAINEKESVSVTLTLTPEDVRACQLRLPSQFMKANGISKLGKITLLGKDEMKWCGCLLTRDGIVAVGIGWDGFCEANGVKLGESFTLEIIREQDETSPVLKFCSQYRNVN